MTAAPTYGTPVLESVTVGAALVEQLVTFAFETEAQRDAIQAGDPFRLAFTREGDTYPGDLALIRMRMRQA